MKARSLVTKILAVVLGCVSLSALSAPPVYRIRPLEFPADIDPLGHPLPVAINDHGVVLGRYFTVNNNFQIGTWGEDGAFTALSGLPKNASQQAAIALNNLGQIVGTFQKRGGKPAESLVTAFLWDPVAGYSEISTWTYPETGAVFHPVALNNSGVVAGYGYSEEGAFSSRTRFWSPATGMVERPRLSDQYNQPYDFNDNFEVLGRPARGFYWVVGPTTGPDKVTFPPTVKLPGKMSVFAMNNRGQVVGVAKRKPFLWDPVRGSQQLLVEGCESEPGYALDINDSEQVVGRTCGEYFYRDPEVGVLPLRALIDPADPLKRNFDYYWALKISNRGEILAYAVRRGQNYPVVLVPSTP